MTSTPVKNVGVGAGGLMPVNTKGAAGGDFQAVWDSRTQKQDTGSPGEENVKTVRKTLGDSLRARDEHRARTEKREPSRNVEERTDIPEEKLAEAAEVLGTAAEGMLREIAGILGVEEQELRDGLAELDMSALDVLKPEKLGELLLQVRDAGDASALLTDEGIYEDYQELMTLLAETLQESGQTLESSPGEIGRMLEQLQEIVPETEPEITVEVIDEREISQEFSMKTEKKPEEISAVRATPEEQTPEETEIRDVGGRAAEETGDESRESHHRSGSREQEGSLFTQNLRTEQPEAQTGTVQIPESAGSADTENIMRQIMDYMKINLKQEVSSMEMQLHPASLGTLQIHIASRGGVITANFLTQNEAVKAALESQMVQLKEQFAEQGVKVEAIEVSVQTHEFERNLDQGREGEGQNRESSRRGRTRRLRLDGVSPGEETKQDDPQAAELSAGGSTVDYMV